MTRKDYIVLAHALSRSRPDPLVYPSSFAQWQGTVREIAMVLADDNAYFQPQKFFDACHYGKDTRYPQPDLLKDVPIKGDST